MCTHIVALTSYAHTHIVTLTSFVHTHIVTHSICAHTQSHSLHMCPHTHSRTHFICAHKVTLPLSALTHIIALTSYVHTHIVTHFICAHSLTPNASGAASKPWDCNSNFSRETLTKTQDAAALGKSYLRSSTSSSPGSPPSSSGQRIRWTSARLCALGFVVVVTNRVPVHR